MRRAMRHLHLMGTVEPSFHRLVPALIRQMGAAYPELGRAATLIGGLFLSASWSACCRVSDGPEGGASGAASGGTVAGGLSAGEVSAGEGCCICVCSFGASGSVAVVCCALMGREHRSSHKGKAKFRLCMDHLTRLARTFIIMSFFTMDK